MQEKKMKTGMIVGFIAIAVLAIGGFALISNSDDEVQTNEVTSSEVQSQEQTIVAVASSDPQFSTLVSAIKAAGLVDTLNGEGPFTVFAPTNEAFEKLPEGALQNLIDNPEELAKVLTYHVVSGDVKAADVVKLTEAETVNGKKVNISVDGEMVKVNDATVTKTDINTSNGTIHVIDTVLLP